MSIGGNPAVAGSITLNNTVEHAKWKSSASATAQDVTTIRLNGTTIWTKPDLQIVQNNPSWNITTERVTISVTRPTLINSWKYKINGGSLVNVATNNTNSIQVGKDSFNEGSNTIKVYGYRDNVLKSESAEKTVTVELDVSISGSVSVTQLTRKLTLTATLGTSLDTWGFTATRSGGGSVVKTGLSATTFTTDALTAGTWTITFKGYKGSVRSTHEETATIESPSISIVSIQAL